MARTSARKTGRPTLAKVAARAGVHPSTASQVLNNRENCWASQASRERILAAAEALDYRPSLQARALTSGRSHTIGFITTALSTTRRIRELDRHAIAHGFTLMTSFSANSADLEASLIQRFNDHSVDGLLIYPSERGRHEGIRALVNRGFPLVVFDGQYHLDFECPSVGPDFAQIGRLQAQHLIERGCRRVCIARPVPSARINLVREAAAQALLHQAGIESTLCEIDREPSQETSDSLELEKPIDDYVRVNAGQFDGVIAFDTVASLFVRSLHRHRLEVPRDVKVVGLGNSVLATHGIVGLTSIDCHDELYADHAMQLLRSQIEMREPPAFQSPKFELVQRMST